jgi:hypothetical protein
LKGLAGRQQKITGKRCGRLTLGTTKTMLSRESRGEPFLNHVFFIGSSAILLVV